MSWILLLLNQLRTGVIHIHYHCRFTTVAFCLFVVCCHFSCNIANGAHLASAIVPQHWLFFCPAPKFGAYFGCLVTKNLKAPKWHWLILDPMGALDHSCPGKKKTTFILNNAVLAAKSRFLSDKYLLLMISKSSSVLLTTQFWSSAVFKIDHQIVSEEKISIKNIK